MDAQKILQTAKETRENLETVLETAGRIHSPLYAQWLRELYNMTAMITLLTSRDPEIEDEEVAAARKKTTVVLLEMSMAIMVQISELALKNISQDLAANGKSISETNLREAFAKDLEALLSRVWSGQSFAISQGPSA